MYFFEHILERLSIRKYKHNIILKGGLLLSSVIGNDERTTKDMDCTLKSLPLERETVVRIIRELLAIDINDGITYKIVNVRDIRQESEYGGFKITLLAEMSTLRFYLAIELTTGDKITPREMEYHYNCIIENKRIPIFAYTIETVLAEKYQTIIDRDIYNTRMKDFYDIFILMKYNKEKINDQNLILAIKNIFHNRGTEYHVKDMQEQLIRLKTSNALRRLWTNYQLTAPYAKQISFANLFEALEDITDKLAKEEITV